jgi:hypothetical protein
MKVKSCPFCGGTNIRYHSYQNYKYCKCNTCFARGPEFRQEYTTETFGPLGRTFAVRTLNVDPKDMSVDLWNTRLGNKLTSECKSK